MSFLSSDTTSVLMHDVSAFEVKGKASEKDVVEPVPKRTKTTKVLPTSKLVVLPLVKSRPPRRRSASPKVSAPRSSSVPARTSGSEDDLEDQTNSSRHMRLRRTIRSKEVTSDSDGSVSEIDFYSPRAKVSSSSSTLASSEYCTSSPPNNGE